MLQTSHPSGIEKLNTLKRKVDDSGADKLAKKSLTQPSVTAVIGSGRVTQFKVDSLTIDFVINDMQAFIQITKSADNKISQQIHSLLCLH